MLVSRLPPTILMDWLGDFAQPGPLSAQPVALQYPASYHPLPGLASRNVIYDLPFSASAQLASHQVTRRTWGFLFKACSVQMSGRALSTVLSICRWIGSVINVSACQN